MRTMSRQVGGLPIHVGTFCTLHNLLTRLPVMPSGADDM